MPRQTNCRMATFGRSRFPAGVERKASIAETLSLRTPRNPRDQAVRKAQLDAFVRSIRTGERPYVDGEDGAWAVRIATGLLESASSVRPVSLEDEGIPA